MAVAASASVLRWTLDPNKYFYADDWAWLWYAEYIPLREMLDPLPTQLYNDRPVGALFIKGLYHLFGLNHVAFHAIFLGIHLVNVGLAFYLARRLLGSDRAAFCAALLFGCWGSALTAPVWVAAVFDLLCCTLVLGALCAHAAGRSPWLVAGLMAVAVRTKEMALLFPLLPLGVEAVASYPWTKEKTRAAARAYAPMLAVMALFGVVYAWIFATQTLPSDSVYHLRIGLGSAFAGLRYYLGALLYVDGHPLLAGAFLAAMAFAAYRRWMPEVFGALGFLVFLGPVLMLPEQRAHLYLYLPSALLWIGVVSAARRGLERIPRLQGKRAELALILLLAAVVQWQFRARYLGVPAWHRNTYRYFLSNLRELREIMPAPPPKVRLFIIGLPEYLNVFHYGPCNSVRLSYRRPDIECIIERPPEETRRLFEQHAGPKLLLESRGGRLARAAE